MPAPLRDRERLFPPSQSGWPMFCIDVLFSRETELTKFCQRGDRHSSFPSRGRLRIPMLVVRAATATKHEPGLSPSYRVVQYGSAMEVWAFLMRLLLSHHSRCFRFFFSPLLVITHPKKSSSGSVLTDTRERDRSSHLFFLLLRASRNPCFSTSRLFVCALLSSHIFILLMALLKPVLHFSTVVAIVTKTSCRRAAFCLKVS